MNAKNNTLMPIRDTLFGDMLAQDWLGNVADGIPWSLFRRAKEEKEKGNELAAIRALNEIIETKGLESRHYLQAYYFLRNFGMVGETETTIFGVVAEIGMAQGFDLLAVYADHSARYYNYSGSAIVWDAQDAVIAEKIDAIISLGEPIVAQIGPWEGLRLPPPKNGSARINFLTPAGLFFGEAPQAALFQDPMAGKLMYAMLDMMETLIGKTQPKNKTL